MDPYPSWLRDMAFECGSYAAVTTDWLQSAGIVPEDFEDRDILEALIVDVRAALEQTTALKLRIDELISKGEQVDDQLAESLEDEMFRVILDLQSLDERCEAAGVPFVD